MYTNPFCGTRSYYNDEVQFRFEVEDGYRLVCLVVDGDSVYPYSNYYYLYMNGTDHTLVVVSEPIPSYTITFVNEGGGYSYCSNYGTFYDTLSTTVTGGNSLYYYMESYSPDNYNYYYGYIDTNAAQLTHLYIDGVEVPLTYTENDVYRLDVYYGSTYIEYYLYIYANADHTVRAVYGPWGSACLPVRNYGSSQVDGTTRNLYWSAYSSPAGYSVVVEQYEYVEYDENGNWIDAYMPTGVSQTFAVSGDSSSVMLTGLQSGYKYYYTIYSLCGDDNTSNAYVTGNFYQNIWHNFTVINNGGGYLYCYGGANIFDTVTVSGSQYDDIEFSIYTLNPNHPDFEYYGIDTNAAQLVHLYLDGDEIQLEDLDYYDDWENSGAYIYYLYEDFYTDHILEAVYGPFGSACTSVRNFSCNNNSDTTVTLSWDAPITGAQSYQVTLEEYDDNYYYVTNTWSYTTDSTYITINGITPHHEYRATVSVTCGDSTLYPVSRWFYSQQHHTVTLVNNGGGYMYDYYNYNRVYDTIVISVTEGNYFEVAMQSRNPYNYSWWFENYGIDSNAAQLTNLYVNGEEIALTGDTEDLYVQDYGDEQYYYYNFDVYEDVTIEAVYGSWGSLCRPVNSVDVYNVTDSTADVEWYDYDGSRQGNNVKLTNLSTGDSTVLYIPYTGNSWNSYTFTGMQPGTQYEVAVYRVCDSDFISAPVRRQFTTTTLVPVTLMNPDGGYMVYDGYIVGDSTAVSYYVTGEDWASIELASFLPTSPYYTDYFNQYIDATALCLTHLYIDGNELPLTYHDGNDYHLEVYDYLDYADEGYLFYRLNFPLDAPHTIIARFGSWDDVCLSPTSLNSEVLGDSVEMHWNGSASAYSLTLTQYDSNYNAVATTAYTVYGNDTVFTGLEYFTDYGVALVTICDSSVSDTIYRTFRTGGPAITVTLLNPDGGYMVYGDYYIVGDTTTLSGNASDEDWFALGLASFLPTSPFYTESFSTMFDTTALRLTHLYLDGNDLPLVNHNGSDYYLEVYDYLEEADNGYIYYEFYFPLTSSHTVKAYFSSWSDSTEVIVDTFTVTLNVNNAAMGSVTGAGQYADGSVVSIQAIANQGYHFDAWSDGDSNASRTLVVTSDITLTANFAADSTAPVIPDTVYYTVTLNVNDNTMGSVAGAGQYAAGSNATIAATAFEGYYFEAWSDGDSNASRTIVVDADITLTANFAADSTAPVIPDTVYYTVTLNVNDSTMGSVAGAGQYVAGSSATITATAFEGYHFVNWSDGDNNASRTIVVDADITLTAIFAADSSADGIDDIDLAGFTVTVRDGQIVVRFDGQTTDDVAAYDVAGRRIDAEHNATSGEVRLAVPATGVYLVRVGGYPARKVVVVK